MILPGMIYCIITCLHDFAVPGCRVMPQGQFQTGKFFALCIVPDGTLQTDAPEGLRGVSVAVKPEGVLVECVEILLQFALHIPVGVPGNFYTHPQSRDQRDLREPVSGRVEYRGFLCFFIAGIAVFQRDHFAFIKITDGWRTVCQIFCRSRS